MLLAQGAVGLVQSLTSLPALAVGLHLFGSALVWTGALQVCLATQASNSSQLKLVVDAETESPRSGAMPPSQVRELPTPVKAGLARLTDAPLTWVGRVRV